MEIIPISNANLFRFHKFRQLSAKESKYVNPLPLKQVQSMIAEWSTELKQGYVALKDGQVVGQLFIRPHYPDKDVLFISLISVLKSEYGTGLSKALMQRAISEAKLAKCHRVKLIVNELNDRAIAFYEHMGFRHTGDFRKGKLYFEKNV